mgnify:CR=1 FL=1
MKNISKEELDKIDLVVQRIAPRYTFSGYDVDDIKQEAFIICYNALDRYDPKVGPLENFLSINLSNRLKNFIRDNHYKKDDEEKKKIMSPTPLTYDHIDSSDPFEKTIILKEIAGLIDEKLPSHLRSDYLKLKSGITINKKRKLEVMETIYDILKESGYDETWQDI